MHKSRKSKRQGLVPTYLIRSIFVTLVPFCGQLAGGSQAAHYD